MSVAVLCTNRCDVYRKTETRSTVSGAVTTAWPTLPTYANLRCLVQTQSSFESFRQGREAGTTAMMVFFPAGTDIRSKDRLTVTLGPAAGRTFYVSSMGNDNSGKGAYTVVSAEEVEGG